MRRKKPGIVWKRCERCGDKKAPKGERFCSHCRGKVLREMRRSGYLTPAPARLPGAIWVCVDEHQASLEIGQWMHDGKPLHGKKGSSPPGK